MKRVLTILFLYRKSLEDRNKESQEFYRSDSDDSVNEDKEKNSECPESLEPETTNNPAELTELYSATIESTEDTNNVVELREHTKIVVEDPTEVASVIENVLEKKVAEATEVTGIMEDSSGAINIIADINNVDMAVINGKNLLTDLKHFLIL